MIVARILNKEIKKKKKKSLKTLVNLCGLNRYKFYVAPTIMKLGSE